MRIKILGRTAADLEAELRTTPMPEDAMSFDEALITWAADDCYAAHFAARQYLSLLAQETGATSNLPALSRTATRC